MLSSFLSIVDSVLTLDEGYSRKDIISGDLVVIDGNLNKDVAGRITGTAALACICNADKNKKFYIIVGKHKIELQGSMDMNPKPLSVVNPNHTTVRVTNDQNRYFEMRFNDAMSFNAWLPKLGEVLAESMCNEVLSSNHTANSIACLNMRRCIHTCELLTSPSKTYVRRVSEIYSIRRKLMEVMGTLRSNPCDVNIKDLRSLKELCWKYPEMQSDPDMKFLLERMPSDRYSSEDLQVILKDILYADPGEGSLLACAHVYHGTGSADLHNQDTSLAVVRAVLVQDAHVAVSSNGLINLNGPTVDGELVSSNQNSTASSVAAPSTATTDTTTQVSVPVHRKSRIVLNGVEIQSSARSPSSAGKVLSKQIKIKSKFTTPAQIRKEVARPKTKTPPSNKKSLLSDVQYNVSPMPSLPVSVLSSPVPASTLASARTPVTTPVAPLTAMKPSSGKVFTPVAAQLDKENVPTPHKNVTPMTMPRSALKKPSSAGKSAQHKLTFAANLDDSSTVLPPAAFFEEQTAPIQVNNEHETVKLSSTMPSSSIFAMNIIPELIAPVESTFNSPMHHCKSKVPFASPTASQFLVQNVANLFEDAVVYNVAIPHNPEPSTFNQDICGSPQPFPVMTGSTGNIGCALNQSHQKRVATSSEKPKSKAYPEDSTGSFEVVLQITEPTVDFVVESLALEESLSLESNVEASVPPAPLELLTAPVATPARAPPVPLDRPLSPPTTAGRKSGSKKQLNVASLQESTTPAKPHRAMHLTTPSTTTGVSAASAVPRTPAPLLSSATSVISLPVPTPVSISMHPVAVSKQKSATKIQAKLAPESLHWRRDVSWKKLALCVVLVALFAAQFTLRPRTIAVPLAGSEVVQMRAPAMTSLANVSFVGAMNTAEAAQPHARPFQPVDATIVPLPAVVAAQPKENGFEMHVRFADASITQTDSAYEPNNRPVPQKPTLLSTPKHLMQRHNVSPLLAQWRRLQRLLTVPAKYARMLLNTAWKKFDRVRRVLAE